MSAPTITQQEGRDVAGRSHDIAKQTELDPGEMTIGDWIKRSKPRQLKAFVATMVGLLIAAFTLGMFVQSNRSSTPSQQAATPRNSDRSNIARLESLLRSPTSGPEVLQVTHPDRLYISKSLPELADSVAGMTSLQADSYRSQVYDGKWIRVRGTVSAVVGAAAIGDAWVMFEFGEIGSSRFCLAKSELDKAKLISDGDEILIEGAVLSLDRASVSFKDAVILEH